jgi:hypothetical protein
VSKVRTQGIDISFSGLNDGVIDVLKRTHLYEKVGADHFYHDVAQAVRSINRGCCLDSDEECPLLASTQVIAEQEWAFKEFGGSNQNVFPEQENDRG